MFSNCADLTLSIFLYLTVRSPIWHYNYRCKNYNAAVHVVNRRLTQAAQYHSGSFTNQHAEVSNTQKYLSVLYYF